MEPPFAAKHVAKIERKHGGRTYVSYLLRQSYRSAGKVKHRTLANLSHLPEPLLDLIRRSLQGEVFQSSDESVRTLSSKPHGHAEAISIAEQLLQIQTAELGPTHPLVMESSSVLGSLYGALGNYGKA